MQFTKNEDTCKEACKVARQFVKSKSTVRKVASELGMPKSTVYRRLIEFMQNPEKNDQERALSKQVRQLLEENKQERSIRGGTTTKNKLLKLKTEKQKNK